MVEEHGNVAPIMIPKGKEIGKVRIDVPYQVVTVLANLYPWLSKGKIAVVTRRCDEKAFAEYFKRELMDRNRIVMIGLACSDEQIARCRCNDPVPSKVHLGEPRKGVPRDDLAEKLGKMSPAERLDFWVAQYRKCNKCFGCTITCPVCFCDDCVLEDRTFVAEKGIPPGMAFHMVRTMHMADKCIECGECERACPAEIPLLTMRKMLAKDMKELYNFAAGDEKTVSPLNTTLDGEPMEDECHEC
jgi:ferredoxin